jgi:hypothetical protein
MKGIVSSVSALVVAGLLSIGCGAPPGVGPTTRAQPTTDTRPPEERLGQATLSQITFNEARLGRALVVPRLIRIQHLCSDERFALKRLDGSDPGLGAAGGPGWIVEAVGTFIGESGDDHIDSLGMHGYYQWDEAGIDSGFGFIPCWTRQPTPPERLEGTCEGVP